MKIGVIANVLQDRPLKEALEVFSGLGIEQIEPGCGGYAGKAHIDPARLLASPKELQELKDMLERYNIKIGALSCHGNPVHPDTAKAEEFHEDMCDTVRLAEKLGVDTISCFSGCPGDRTGAKYPNWVTCAWPDDYPEILRYQWDDVLIPYWRDFVSFAREYGVKKIALELHPGFSVYNSETLRRLHDAAGPEIGATLDPSHLIWQGMDPVAVIRECADLIYNVHAKDVKTDKYNIAINGVLDTKHYGDELHRSWIFRTVGYGNDAEYWKDIFSTLRRVGYDGNVSIEHEDSLINRMEGLEKAVEMVKSCIIQNGHTEIWWA